VVTIPPVVTPRTTLVMSRSIQKRTLAFTASPLMNEGVW
jgi:hypothetical protein